MDLTFSFGKVIKVFGFYAPNRDTKNENYHDMEKFLDTLHSVVLLGDYNKICFHALNTLARVQIGKAILASWIYQVAFS